VDVFAQFASLNENAAEAFIKKNSQKYYCDLYHLARLELNSLGVKHISGGDQCTYAQEDDYYSHRRHSHQRLVNQQSRQSNCGRMASLIWLSTNNRINNEE